MLKWILVFIVVYYIYKFMNKKGIDEPQSSNSSYEKNDNTVDILVKDPNCGKYIPKEKALRVEIKGEIYYFCSLQCAKEYQDKIDKGEI